jgi:hypothetical protein
MGVGCIDMTLKMHVKRGFVFELFLVDFRLIFPKWAG